MFKHALARQLRPRQFGDVVGHDAICQTLRQCIAKKNLAQVLLFTGHRGIGKTSMARLLALAVNCKDATDGEPCLACSNCKSILAQSAFDVLEIDAASNTRIEEIQDILSHCQYPPRLLNQKVIIVDEVHMLSRHSFNALLKILEEPPQYMLFILATTNPEKIPDTVKSRCLTFHLKTATPAIIEQHLHDISNQHNLHLPEATITTISQQAGGSFRDALSYFEKALLSKQANEGDEHVSTSFASIQRLLNAIIQKDPDTFEESLQALLSSDLQAIQRIEQLIMALAQEICVRPHVLLFEIYDYLQKSLGTLKHTAYPELHFDITCRRCFFHVNQVDTLQNQLSRLTKSDKSNITSEKFDKNEHDSLAQKTKSQATQTDQHKQNGSVQSSVPPLKGIAGMLIKQSHIEYHKNQVTLTIKPGLKNLLTPSNQESLTQYFADQGLALHIVP